MKCTHKNIDVVFEILKSQMEDENGRGEFDNESDLQSAIETVIAWVEDERGLTNEQMLKLRNYNESAAFTIYGASGQPLAYIIPVEDGCTGENKKELNERESDACMDLFNGKSNGDSCLKWKEVF